MTLPRLPRPLRAACALSLSLLAGPTAWAAELLIGAVPSPLSIPIEVAQTQGYFAAAGLKARWVDCVSGVTCLQKLATGELQFASATDMSVVVNGLQHRDAVVVATITKSTANIQMIARRSAGITRPEQLVGKRIGAILGTSAEYYLDSFLYFHDIDPSRVTIVPLKPGGAVRAIETRQIDAIAGHVHYAGAVTDALGADAVPLPDPRIYTETYNLVVTKRFLAAQRGAVIGVLRALQRANDHIAAHPDRVKSLMTARHKFDRAYVDRIYPTYTYRLSLDPSLVSTMEGLVRWAGSKTPPSEGAASARTFNVLDIIDSGPLREAVPSALAD